ncbi:hypothetical protein SELMODRAFT_412060 [Selaginella moellendorffii]|uniref:Uncharacterized protein n=1 Tax=Selaginella moellendorffii TaxID=88036 RepID=D8RJX8_SELML|nr:hypothetical protein SELMODRAFT_412060 [Selaginella moellendorffii]
MSRIVSLPEEDLCKAECTHEAMTVWRSDCWLPFAYDAELFNLLAVLYICLSNNHSEFQACLAHLHTTSSDDLQRLDRPEIISRLARMGLELRCLADEVVDCYKRESVVLGKKEWDEYFRLGSQLSVANCSGQGKKLLSAMYDEQGSGLLASLCTQRPPQSAFLSHLFALFDCTTNARLWLCRSTLPVYYAFSNVHKPHVFTSDLLREKQNLLVSTDQNLMSFLGSFQERVPSLSDVKDGTPYVPTNQDGKVPLCLEYENPRLPHSSSSGCCLQAPGHGSAQRCLLLIKTSFKITTVCPSFSSMRFHSGQIEWQHRSDPCCSSTFCFKDDLTGALPTILDGGGAKLA